MKKVGIIRCQQTEDMCPGTVDFKFAALGKGSFAETGACEVVGFVSCGGCPGKKVLPRVKMMLERGANVIAFASCMKNGNPTGFACPHFQQIEKSVKDNISAEITVLDWTH